MPSCVPTQMKPSGACTIEIKLFCCNPRAEFQDSTANCGADRSARGADCPLVSMLLGIVTTNTVSRQIAGRKGLIRRCKLIFILGFSDERR
jgi:hypothetical protein